MLVVETIGKVRRDYLVRKKGIKAIVWDRHLSRNAKRYTKPRGFPLWTPRMSSSILHIYCVRSWG